MAALAHAFAEVGLDATDRGIYTREDVERLRDCGARSVLVGESLMREMEIPKLRELTGTD